MRLDELYPYWKNAHEELQDSLRPLSSEQLEARPREGAPSIRDLALDLLYHERFWVSHLVAGNAYEKPRPDLYPDGRSLVEALAAARQVTARVLEPFSREGLRAVRHVPADSRENRPETNMPVGWLFWHVLEREIYTWGQVALRIEDSAPPRRRRP